MGGLINDSWLSFSKDGWTIAFLRSISIQFWPQGVVKAHYLNSKKGLEKAKNNNGFLHPIFYPYYAFVYEYFVTTVFLFVNLSDKSMKKDEIFSTFEFNTAMKNTKTQWTFFAQYVRKGTNLLILFLSYIS